MGYVYYGNYAMYFEVARVEALRTPAFLQTMEDDGIIMPVLELHTQFIKPGSTMIADHQNHYSRTARVHPV